MTLQNDTIERLPYVDGGLILTGTGISGESNAGAKQFAGGAGDPARRRRIDTSEIKESQP